MRWIQLRKRCASRSGQSLIETALLLPLILLAAFNAINFGYFFIVALHLAAAPRAGVEYSIQGFQSPMSVTLPIAGPNTTTCTTTSCINTTVSNLTYKDLSTLNASASAVVRVCSEANGLNNKGAVTQTAVCTSYGSGGSFAAVASDPESPLFVLQRVDVQYTITPLISAMPLTIGGVNLGLLTPDLTFHRQVSMRAIN